MNATLPNGRQVVIVLGPELTSVDWYVDPDTGVITIAADLTNVEMGQAIVDAMDALEGCFRPKLSVHRGDGQATKRRAHLTLVTAAEERIELEAAGGTR